MKKRSTKSAMLSAVMALVICFTALVGTTFAWFTDSVTSANNIITAGNLDIELEYWDGDSWETVEGEDEILDPDALWEPGYTAVVYLRVRKLGTLDLKYQLGVNIVTETAGTNVAGDEFLLSDYIYFDVFDDVNGEDENSAFADRAAAMANTTETTLISDGFNRAGSMMADSAPKYLAMVVYMPTTVGNVANHNGTDKPEIELGITMLATQLASEQDSFGSDYDEDAVHADHFVSDAASLATAIENAEDGAVIALTEDITLGNPMARSNAFSPIVIAKGKNITLNLNGKNITLVDTVADKNGDNQLTSADNAHMFTVKGGLSVIGGGTLTMQHTGDNMGWNALTTLFSVEGGTLTLGEGVNALHMGGSDMAYVVDVNTTGGTSVLNVDGAILYSTYVGVRIFNNLNGVKGIVNYNSGIISGVSRDIWAQKANGNVAVENSVINTAFPYTTNENGDRYYFAQDVAFVSDVDALKAALKDNAVITIIGEIANATIKLPANLKNVTIKGGTLKNSTISAADGNSYNYEGLTFDGITFDNSRLLFTGWRNGEEVLKDMTVTNCVFKNLDDTTNTAPVHINKDATEAVVNFTFTNNVIDGATGGSKSGIYLQATGKVTVTGNVINNVSFRPFVIQITTNDGVADEFIVTGNTFSGSAVGRAQGLGNVDNGTDSVKLVVTGNIFKDITDAQQICYWNFNDATTTTDFSGNYYDIDIVANPGKIYYNGAATDAADLVAKSVTTYYTALNADGTIDLNSLVVTK